MHACTKFTDSEADLDLEQYPSTIQADNEPTNKGTISMSLYYLMESCMSVCRNKYSHIVVCSCFLMLMITSQL